MRASQQGVTLIEMIFVFIIMGTILVLAFRQYQSYQLDQDLQQVRANVRTLFQAMAGYYKANCIQNRDYYSGDALTPGALDPTVSNLGTTVPLDISTELVPLYLPRWPVTDVPAIIDNNDNKGYVVQFNRAPIVSRIVTTNVGDIEVGRIFFWNIQVAIRLANPDLADTFKNLLVADCTSTLQGSTVLPCSDGSHGSYLVWSLSPANAMGEGSTLWMTTHQLLPFKRQYTTDTMRALNDPDFAANQYYLCGG